MQTITDWQALWKELVELRDESRKLGVKTPAEGDFWKSKARQYDQRVKERWGRPDLTRDLVLRMLGENDTLLDIGAGSGAWSMLFAKKCQAVTAIEPSAAMRELLMENIRSEGINNIEVLPEKWLDALVGPHDLVFCAHAMYEEPDLVDFLQKMIVTARKTCFLLIRAPYLDGLLAEAFQHVWQQPYDSPNFVIAYNVLLQMGVHANVQFEAHHRGHLTVSPTKNDAFIELKQRLGLRENAAFDDYLRDLLERRLVLQDGQYLWPGGSRSALMYWDVLK